MENIAEKLKEKGLSDTSVKMYLRNLEKLNDDKPFKNLNFLKKVDNIIEKIKDKKDNTQRSYLISIVSVLDCFYCKESTLYKKYHELMLNKNDEIKQKPKNEMSESQEKNWKKWDDILKDFNELKEKVKVMKGTKLNKNQYGNLLSLVVSSLYVYQEPRRNQDYQKMMKVKKYNDKLPNDTNYIDDENFIFNVYKTSKKYGQKVIKINEELKPILNLYYKYVGKPKSTPRPFLVDFEGEPLSVVNSITRILNKVFNKNIGSSMLRHIYLTNKFGDNLDEMKKTADNMGHTVETQKDYIKNDKPKKMGGITKSDNIVVNFN